VEVSPAYTRSPFQVPLIITFCTWKLELKRDNEENINVSVFHFAPALSFCCSLMHHEQRDMTNDSRQKITRKCSAVTLLAKKIK